MSTAGKHLIEYAATDLMRPYTFVAPRKSPQGFAPLRRFIRTFGAPDASGLMMSVLKCTNMAMLDGAVRRMREKYKMMLSLRLERERLEAQGIMRLEGDSADARRSASRALASAYPGALKQLDRMDSGMMESRLELLESWLDMPDAGEVAIWCQLEAGYHALLADFLAAKKWLAENSNQGLSDAVIWERWKSQGLFQETVWEACAFGEPLVAMIRRPPGGRLSELVWKSLSEVFREPVDVLKAQLAVWQEEQ